MSHLRSLPIIGRMTSPELTAARSVLLQTLPPTSFEVSLTSTKLPGGTEAAGVFRVTARYSCARGRQQRRFVIKHLVGRARRESKILQELTEQHGGALLPELVGTHDDGEGNSYLCLKEVRRSAAWPWRNSATTAALMNALGGFHAAKVPHITSAFGWDSKASSRRAQMRHAVALTRAAGIRTWPSSPP